MVTSAWEHHYGESIPLLAHPELVHAIERGEVYGLQDRLDACRKQNVATSFPLDRVKKWLEERTSPFTLEVDAGWVSKLRDGLLMLPLDHVLERKTSTRVWVHERQLYVVGPAAAALIPWLTPHEAINANPMVAVFREDLRVRNPFTDTAFEKVIADARKFGLDLTGALVEQRKTVSDEPFPLAVPPFDAAEEQMARRMLRSLADRAWHFEADLSWRREPTTIPLWLRRAAASPLLLRERASEQLCVTASMGAGRLMSVRLLRFVATQATPFRKMSAYVFDGGDVRLWITTGYDDMLDADTLAPTRHRRQESED